MADARLSAGSEVLTKIVDFFATTQEGLGDMWAHPDDRSSYDMDYRHRDGTQLWLDLDKSGVIKVLWRAAGQENPTIVRFAAITDDAQQAQGCGDPSCQDPNCDYGKQDDALRAEIRSLRIDNARLRDEAAIRALAAQPPAAPVETERKTFTIPPGHEAVRDSEGRATGEVRPRSSAGNGGEK